MEIEQPRKCNHEFRIPTNKETYELVRIQLWRKFFNNYKWTGLLEKIFLLGIDQIKLQIAQQNQKKKVS